MEWTQKLPSESGYYWFSSELSWSGKRETEIVEIDMFRGGWYADLMGTDVGFLLEWAKPHWWWMGPLDVPELL